MKKILVLLAMGSTFSAASFGAACVVETLDLFFTPSCEIGTLSFSNFAGFNASPAGTTGLTANQIQVTPSLGPTGPVLTFAPTVSFSVNLTGTSNAFNFQYDVSNGLSSPLYVSLGLNGSTNGLGSASGTKDINLGLSSVFNNGGSGVFTGMGAPIFVPGASFTVKDGVSIQSQSGTASITSFSNTFAVPEPMTLSLMGIGLLAVGVLGRRFKK